MEEQEVPGLTGVVQVLKVAREGLAGPCGRELEDSSCSSNARPIIHVEYVSNIISKANTLILAQIIKQ